MKVQDITFEYARKHAAYVRVRVYSRLSEIAPPTDRLEISKCKAALLTLLLTGNKLVGSAMWFQKRN